MKCPKCQFENREEAKFCEQCGTRLACKCPDCGAEVSLTARFCAECGHALRVSSEQLPKDLSFEEKLEKIQCYLPGGLIENEGTIEPSDWWYPSPWYIPERSKRSAIPR